MRRAYDHNTAGNRLAKARIAAGHSSGLQAATSLGWNTGTYGYDEAGSRPLPIGRARLYARGFGVSAEWLAEGFLPPEDDQSEEAERTRKLDWTLFPDVAAVFLGLNALSAATIGANDRLREARLAAGFAKAANACDRFDWVRPTYYAHENGSSGLRSDTCQIYAFAFRSDAEWLLMGNYLGRGPRRSEEPLPSAAEVRKFTAKLRAKRPQTNYRGPGKTARSDGVSRAGFPRRYRTGATPKATWFEYARAMGGEQRLRIFATAADVPDGSRIAVGDRVEILGGDRDGEDRSPYLAIAIEPGKVRIVKAGGKLPKDAIGTVRAILVGET